MNKNIMQDNVVDFEKLKKVTDLIQEAKPLYFKEKARKASALKICAVFAFVFFSLGTLSIAKSYGVFDVIKYGQTLCAQDYGFPVDSYGLIMVDDEF